jgi:glycosyltransferase involved in cell wall biosynthesis
MELLVSIIIPTHNRAHLIGDTLNSIIAQTYTNWECIIIDDGSADNTYDLASKYCAKDYRIEYYQRPAGRPKGANTCRNYGFELSKGVYVKWFDSDDIMLSDHLAILVNTLQNEKVDFVIGDSLTFEEGTEKEFKPYEFDKSNVQMDALKFAQSQIGWITDDFLGKKTTLTDCKFNEKLEDGHEYNLFVRYLLSNNKGVFVDKIITKMRVHPQSLGVLNKTDKLNHKRILAEIKILTLEDVFVVQNKPLNDWFLSGYVQVSFDLALNGVLPPSLLKGFRYMTKIKNIPKGFIFLLSIITAYWFKSGYILNKYSRN